MKILRRGYSYYLDERIIDCSNFEENKYKFLIEGTQIYEVEITIDLEGVSAMTCTCPFAQTDNCKHMAAALYGLKNGVVIKEQKLNKSNSETKLSDYDQFKNKILEKIIDFPYFTYEDQDFVCEVIYEGIDMINVFIDNQNYPLALKSTLYLYELALDEEITGDFYIDDDLLPKLNILLCKFITIVNIEDILLKIIDLDRIYCFENIVKSICETLKNPKINERCIKLVGNIDEFKFDCDRKNVLIFQLTLLDDKETAIKMLYRYKDYDMLEYMLDYLGDDFTLSLEIIENFYDYDLTECPHFDRYIEIYQKHGVDEKYYYTLIGRTMMIGDFRCYELLKDYSKYNYYKDELEEAIMRVGSIYDKIDLCILNEQYDTLFILCKDRIDLVEKHFELLKNEYYVELTLIYKNEIFRICKDGAGQDRYDQICKNLLTMSRLKKSKSTAIEVIAYIRENYKGRKKLLDDLVFIEATIL